MCLEVKTNGLMQGPTDIGNGNLINNCQIPENEMRKFSVPKQWNDSLTLLSFGTGEKWRQGQNPCRTDIINNIVSESHNILIGHSKHSAPKGHAGWAAETSQNKGMINAIPEFLEKELAVYPWHWDCLAYHVFTEYLCQAVKQENCNPFNLLKIPKIDILAAY